jgi:ferredoxin
LPFISDKTYEIREFIRWEMLYFEMPSFPSTLFLIILGGVLAIGIFVRRGFCRWLCPLGALLGLCGRWAPVRRYADVDTCIECKVCPSECRTSAIDEDGKSHNQSECVLCLDCKYECRVASIHFLPGRNRETAQVKYGISRRRFLYAMGSGVVAGVALAYGNGIFNKQKIKDRIRPPGVIRGSGFEERCIKCGECMKVCPTGGLQPVTSTNLEDLWTPELVPRIGYCEFNCNMCGQICPTKAIPEISLEEKQRFKLGTSRIDRKRCIPWVENAHCGVCEEHCPVSPKAIVLIESESGDVLLPVVRSGFCIGCGQCEHVCPVEGESAIVVTVEGAGTYAGGGGGLGKGNRRGKR